MGKRVTRSQTNVDHMLTRKVIVNEDIKNHYLTTEFLAKTSTKLSDNQSSFQTTYTLTIQYHDATSPNYDLTTLDLNTNLPNPSNPPLFLQINKITLSLASAPRTLKGIDLLLKAYYLSETDKVIINEKVFEKEDIKHFIDIIYKCIVFSQCESTETIKSTCCAKKPKTCTKKLTDKPANGLELYNIYAHILYRIADKVGKSLGFNSSLNTL
jgi:hypothetical protein